MTAKELKEKAYMVAIEHFFCNIDDDNFPSNIDDLEIEINKSDNMLNVWEPFKRYSPKELYTCVYNLIESIVYYVEDKP